MRNKPLSGTLHGLCLWSCLQVPTLLDFLPWHPSVMDGNGLWCRSCFWSWCFIAAIETLTKTHTYFYHMLTPANYPPPPSCQTHYFCSCYLLLPHVSCQVPCAMWLTILREDCISFVCQWHISAFQEHTQQTKAPAQAPTRPRLCYLSHGSGRAGFRWC